LWANQEIRINMTKNMTRKGLALGAASALLISGFSALPASSAGLADTSFVSLAPTTGTEYNVLAKTGTEFSLTSNEAVTVSTGDLKWLVTDPSGVIETTQATTGEAIVVADNSVITVAIATDTLTIADGVLGARLKEGDKFVLADDLAVDAFAASGFVTTPLVKAADNDFIFTVSAVAADKSTFSFVSNIDYALFHDTNANDGTVATDFAGAVNGAAIDGEVIREARHATNNTFVVDSGITDAATDEVLVLKKDASVTARSVTVQAWMDANDNDLVDSTEYTSPLRTVSWLANSAITAVTTLTYPTSGDTSVVANVALTPNLNGNQIAAGDVQVTFTRPGATAGVTASATQNATSRAWSATQSLETGNWVGLKTIFQISGNTTDDTTDLLYPISPAGSFATGDIVDVDGTKDNNNDTVTVAAVVTGGTASFTLDDAVQNAHAAVTAETGFARVVSRILTSSEAALTYVEFDTTAVHGLSVGDIVTTDSSITANANQMDLARAVVSAVPSTTKFRIAGTFVVDPADGGETGKVTYVGTTEATPGTYSAKATVNTVVIGNLSTNSTIASTADDTTLATTATVNVQGVSSSDATDGAFPTAAIRKNETTVELTATVVDVNDVAVTAGRSVKVSLETTQGNGTTKVGTFSVNGALYSTAVYLTTDANGQVTFTVSDNDGAVGTEVRVLVVPENLTGAKTADLELLWDDTAYSIYDLNDNNAQASTLNNSVVANGTYIFSLGIYDQWKNAPANGTHRVKYATTGNTVATNYLTLASGLASYSLTDAQVGAGTAISTALTVEKLGTDGTTWTQQDLGNDGNTDGAADTVTASTSVVSATATFAVLLDTAGSTAYGDGVAALTAVANVKALVAQDRRTSNLVQPAYATNNLVTGRVSNATTNVVRAGAAVTISGPTSILFSDGAVDALGSLTIVADANGEFGVKLYSNTVQTNTVITVTSGGVSSTVKVSFTGQGASFGTAIAIDAPLSVSPGTSFKVSATLTDKQGNIVASTTGARMLVTYTGPGITIAAMPTDTDVNGKVSFTVLLGTNDSGSGVVTVSYDQGDDGDFTGTTVADADVVATAIVTVGAVASAEKVNVGTFKGYVALYAKGYEGQKMSAIVAGKWIVVESLASDFERVVRFTGAGYTITTKIYIDGVQIGSEFTTVTK
jgi:hypothetical protein